MAAELQIGGSDEDRVFLDTDLTRDFKVADLDTDSTGATAKDISGWAITFDIRKADKSSTVKMTKTATVTGTFNTVLTTSTQVARVTIADTDLTTTLFGTNGGTYRYSLKRTDAGAETVLAYGDIVIQRATQV